MAVKMMNVVCVMIACMVVFAPLSEAALTCGQVVSKMMPCLTFLRNGGAVPQGCCSGVKGLNAAAQSTPDRKTACGCLKSAYAANPGIDGKNALSLPGKCGVSIPYKISPNTDCSKVV